MLDFDLFQVKNPVHQAGFEPRNSCLFGNTGDQLHQWDIPEIHDSTSWSHNAPPPLPRFVTPWDFNDSIPCDPSGDNTHVQQDSQSSYSPSEPSFSVDQSEPSIINSTDTPTVTRSGRQVTKNPRYFNEMHANSAYLDTFSPDESVSARGSQSTTAWT
jgi:hypothetical protein